MPPWRTHQAVASSLIQQTSTKQAVTASTSISRTLPPARMRHLTVHWHNAETSVSRKPRLVLMLQRLPCLMTASRANDFYGLGFQSPTKPTNRYSHGGVPCALLKKPDASKPCLSTDMRCSLCSCCHGAMACPQRFLKGPEGSSICLLVLKFLSKSWCYWEDVEI